jgi:tRNA modification GTPase
MQRPDRTVASATRVCVLTPEGRGAVAVVRVWGPNALEVVDTVFRPRRAISLARTAHGRLRLGRIGEGIGDEVVAVIVERNPPEVEIQCHGGPAPLAMVVDALEAAGAERRQPVAWVRHASRSAVAAEAEVDLARAPTVRSAEILLDQYHGALEQEIACLLPQLSSEPETALRGLDILLRRSDLGLRLISGWTIVLAGRPNVGKSRLLNTLAGYQRAIVDPTPGTTRDVVTIRTAVDGWPVEIADTAGLRESDDAIEAEGIALARERQRAADLVVRVLDRSMPLMESDLAWAASGDRNLAVANKCDLPAAWQVGRGVLEISAERGDGIDDLIAAIGQRLVPEAPPPGAGVPFRPRHVRRLQGARSALASGDPASPSRYLATLLGALPRRVPGRSSANPL